MWNKCTPSQNHITVMKIKVITNQSPSHEKLIWHNKLQIITFEQIKTEHSCLREMMSFTIKIQWKLKHRRYHPHDFQNIHHKILPSRLKSSYWQYRDYVLENKPIYLQALRSYLIRTFSSERMKLTTQQLSHNTALHNSDQQQNVKKFHH